MGIELGGLMRSTDGGLSWDDHRPGAQRDVHSLAWHPRDSGRAYEAAAAARRGATTAATRGSRPTTGATGTTPGRSPPIRVDPELWYVSASTGPFAAHGGRNPQARIFRRRGDDPWQALRGGLPDPLHAMPYALATSDESVFAGFADGQVWRSDDRGDTWERLELAGARPTALHALVIADGRL